MIDDRMIRSSLRHASISSNRISYSLGLRGASASVDTACSSSLVALHIACKELGLGMMAALCTGVQLNLIAEPFVAFSKALRTGC